MYGDPGALRRRVDQLREQAVDVRALADELVARTEATGWEGRAAESLRVRVGERAHHLRVAASRHETAADSLERHVQEVSSLQEQVAAVERRAGDLVADARTRVAGLPDLVEPDADDVTLLAFEPPPSGHRDWLTVELPGLLGGSS